MKNFIRFLLGALKGIATFLGVFLVYHTLVRIIRHFYKFPMPHFLAGLIDNPWRRKYIHPPEEMIHRHCLEPGMTVLEVGPGSGTYTLAAGRCVGPDGKVVTMDIEPRIIAKVREVIDMNSAYNIEAIVGNVYGLAYKDGSFDAAYMITVIGEIPEPQKAFAEIYRLLRPGGTLAFSESLIDPDYPLVTNLEKMAYAAGFHLKQKTGNFFNYSVVFQK